MKKRTASVTLCSIAVATALLLSGCGVFVTAKDLGPTTTRSFAITDFDTVEAGSAFQVDIQQSESYSVQVTASENDFDSIVVEKSGRTLKIGVKWPGMIFGVRHFEARITMPELAKLTLSGATKASVRGFTSASDRDVRVSGASNLDIEGAAGLFSSEVTGSSRLTANVTSTTADIRLSGASDTTLDMVTGNFYYESSGSGSGTGSVQATNTTLRLSGASRIKLTGSGGDLDMTGSGSSSLSLIGYNIGNVRVDLSGASNATLDTDGAITGSLSGGSGLLYGGNPVLAGRLDITGGSRFERRK